MGTSGAQSTRNCVKCGRQIAWDANVCPFCGHDFRAPGGAQAPHEKGALSLVGGILILVAGLMGLVLGIMLMTIDIDELVNWTGVDIGDTLDFVEDILDICGAIAAIFGIIAVLGGLFGVMRKHYGLVILGGVFGLLCVGPFGVGSLLALVGLILVIVSKKDFD